MVVFELSYPRNRSNVRENIPDQSRLPNSIPWMPSVLSDCFDGVIRKMQLISFWGSIQSAQSDSLSATLFSFNFSWPLGSLKNERACINDASYKPCLN